MMLHETGWMQQEIHPESKTNIRLKFDRKLTVNWARNLAKIDKKKRPKFGSIFIKFQPNFDYIDYKIKQEFVQKLTDTWL